MIRSLLTLAPLAILVACDPLAPHIPFHSTPSHVHAGSWVMELSDARMSGRCGGIRPSELENALLDVFIDTPSETALVIAVDGLELRGDRVGDRFKASGFMPMDQDEPDDPTTDHPMPGEDEDDPGGDEGIDDGGGETGVECEAAPGGHGCEPDERGVFARMRGEVDSPTLIFGDLILDFEIPEMSCQVDVAFSAEFVGEDPNHPLTSDDDDDVGIVEEEAQPGARALFHP